MFDHRCLKISIRFLLQVKYFKVRASRIGLLNSVFTLQLFLILCSYVWNIRCTVLFRLFDVDFISPSNVVRSWAILAITLSKQQGI